MKAAAFFAMEKFADHKKNLRFTLRFF